MELKKTARIDLLKERMLSQPRYVSMEQAMIITRAYQRHEEEPVILKRAYALHDALCELEIGIEPQELIVGNRTKGYAMGWYFLKAVFPGWIRSWRRCRRVHRISSVSYTHLDVYKRQVPMSWGSGGLWMSWEFPLIL